MLNVNAVTLTNSHTLTGEMRQLMIFLLICSDRKRVRRENEAENADGVKMLPFLRSRKSVRESRGLSVLSYYRLLNFKGELQAFSCALGGPWHENKVTDRNKFGNKFRNKFENKFGI